MVNRYNEALCIQVPRFPYFYVMPKMLLLATIATIFWSSTSARTYTDEQAHAAWNGLKVKIVTQENFSQTCDLVQDVAQTNIGIAYQILSEYLPIIKRTGNRQWIHVLLMSWA